MISIRRKRRDRAEKRRKLRILNDRASKIINSSMIASMNTWGGTRCPGCGIKSRPLWILPWVCILNNSSRIYGTTLACEGPGASKIKCHGPKDWN